MELTIQKWGNSAALRLPAPLLALLGVQIGDAFSAEVNKGSLALRPAKPKPPLHNDAAIEAMKFALQAPDGMEFLRLWMEGNFASIRKEWPNAPDAIFAGAETLGK